MENRFIPGFALLILALCPTPVRAAPTAADRLPAETEARRLSTPLPGSISGSIPGSLSEKAVERHAGGPMERPAAISPDAPVRVKDLGRLLGWRENALYGSGIVTGLAGTGDSPGSRGTRQALANALSRLNLNLAPEQIQSRNVALVMVSAALPAFARTGDTLDITVTSAGDARSLVGGSLMLTPLAGADGRVRALAQGPLSVGGYRYDANGNVVQKNHPTVGAVSNGASVEVGVTADMLQQGRALTFVLNESDYTTASRVAAAINERLGGDIAVARDAGGIDIEVPAASRGALVDFMARLESVTVAPDRRARVVINERTGTVVSGGDVRIDRVAISHGDLKISIAMENSLAAPVAAWGAAPAGAAYGAVIPAPWSGAGAAAGRDAGGWHAGVVPGLVTNTRIDVEEGPGTGFLAAGNTVSDLVQSLARMGTSTRDIISILRAVKAAGALHAELVVL